MNGLPEGAVYVIAGGRTVAPAFGRAQIIAGTLAHQDFTLVPGATRTAGQPGDSA